MIHNTATVTRTKALITAPTAMVIARAISHGQRIRPHYPVPDHAADQTMCDVLDDHYGPAGGVPLRPPELFNRPDPLKFEHHCASTTAAFAVDVWQFNRAGLVDAAVSVCSRVGTRQGTIDKYSENHVYFRSSTGATRLTASSWDNNETTPGTDNLNTLLFNDSGDVSVGYDIWRVPITTTAGRHRPQLRHHVARRRGTRCLRVPTPALTEAAAGLADVAGAGEPTPGLAHAVLTDGPSPRGRAVG